ncbi:MAG: hypothetical protein RL026_2570 [Pseudomonadota bacterium]|jgi:F0F1-type ATP synthase assembly protein I
MILTRDPETRRTAARILRAQVYATLLLGALCAGFFGARHGANALAGGAIGLAVNLFMTLLSLRPTRSAGGALLRLLVGQFGKWALTVAMFVIVARSAWVSWLPLLAGFIATLLVFVAVPARQALRNTGQPVQGDQGSGQG